MRVFEGNELASDLSLCKKEKEIMDLFKRAEAFENRTLRNMSTSDRVSASREAKELILSINEIYKRNKDASLMDLMKRLTAKKRKIEKRIKGVPLI